MQEQLFIKSLKSSSAQEEVIQDPPAGQNRNKPTLKTQISSWQEMHFCFLNQTTNIWFEHKPSSFCESNMCSVRFHSELNEIVQSCWRSLSTAFCWGSGSAESVWRLNKYKILNRGCLGLASMGATVQRLFPTDESGSWTRCSRI